MTKDLAMAYKKVLNDLVLNGSSIFSGVYDAKHGSLELMYGVSMVMEAIAIRSSEKDYEDYDRIFSENMRKSLDKAKLV